MVEITPDDSSLSARLEATPEAAYEFYAYLVIDGKNYTSERVVFTTLKEGEQPGGSAVRNAFVVRGFSDRSDACLRL